MRWLLPVLVAAFLFTGFVRHTSNESPLQAGTAVRMELEEMVDAADRIVEARITGRRTAPQASGQIVTEYDLLVRRNFLGEETQTVRIPGGVLANGRGLMLPGMPRITVGEEVLLFLNGDQVQMPTGLTQGKFRVMTDRAGMRQAVRQGSGAAAASGAHAADGHTCSDCRSGGVERLPYAELSARIQARVTDRLAREAFDAPHNDR